MNFKLLTKHHLEFLILTGGCTGSSEYTLFKLPHCWKTHVATHIYFSIACLLQILMQETKVLIQKAVQKKIEEKYVHICIFYIHTLWGDLVFTFPFINPLVCMFFVCLFFGSFKSFALK